MIHLLISVETILDKGGHSLEYYIKKPVIKNLYWVINIKNLFK